MKRVLITLARAGVVLAFAATLPLSGASEPPDESTAEDSGDTVQWVKADEITRMPPTAPVRQKAPQPVFPSAEEIRAIENLGQDAKPSDIKSILRHSNESARAQPDSEYFQNARMVFDYEEGRLYQVYTALLHHTDIALEPGEVLTSDPTMGETSRWKIAKAISGAGVTQRLHILIKPTRPGLSTNLTLYTNKRAYHLEVHSFKNTYMSQIAWEYPAQVQNLAYAQQLNEFQTVVDDNLDPTSLNHNYKIEAIGDRPRWFPVGVFDDGRKVYIQFPEALDRFEAPALFIVRQNGKVQLVNYRKKGLYYEVDRLFERADLRVGSGNDVEVVRITFAPAKEKYQLYW